MRLTELARDPSLFVQPIGPEDELVEDWYERWLAMKRTRGQSSAKASGSHLEFHILPVLRGTAMAKVTTEQLERIVQNLDAKVDAGDLMWKSALNIWGTVTKAFDDAARGKVAELRVRRDNPAASVRGPDRGVDTEQVHLFPDEFLQLVQCAGVPGFRRRCYAVAVYCYLRPGELEALAWGDIDLERGTMQVRRSVDRETGLDTSPKAGKARAPFSIEPALLPLLRAMHKESGGEGYVVGRLGDERKLAEILRADLITAGVTRHELHNANKSPPRDWLRMHDCRTTGVTWMAVRGDQPMVIMARAGHEDMKTTLGYVSRAALAGQSYGRPFPPLPKVLSSGRGFGREIVGGLKEKAAMAEAHGNRIDPSASDRAVSRRFRLVKGGERFGTTPAIPADLGGPAETHAETPRARKVLVGKLARALERAFWREDMVAFADLLDALGEHRMDVGRKTRKDRGA